MRMAVVCVIFGALTLASSGPLQARPRPYVPEPGDTSLRAKCKSDVSMMGGGGGRGAAQRSMQVREMRRDYFRKCMQGG